MSNAKNKPVLNEGFSINQHIIAKTMQVIDQDGQNLGVISRSEALAAALQAGSDLVQVGEREGVVIAKIMDFGKFKYAEAKKERENKPKDHGSEVKMLRIGVKTARHDQERYAKQAEEFLAEGHRVRVDMILRGREKALRDFAKERFHDFIALIPGAAIDIPVGPGTRGLTVVLKKA